MTTIALIHEHFDDEKLEAVMAEMEQIGTPVIRAVWMECFGVWAALEGCHRIRAAKALGLEPVIEEIEYSDMALADLGCDDADEGYTVDQIADAAYQSVTIEF